MNNYEWLDTYLLAKPGVTKDYKEEWQWWRYMVGGKMFAATMHPSEKYAPEYAEKDLVNLKCEPMLAELLRREHPEILPGFYTNKANWNAVVLSGTLPDTLLREMCDQSYTLIFTNLTKKAQREITGE